MPTTDAGAEGVAAVRRSWPCKVRPRRAWPWRGVVAELRHAAVRRQADNTCSRGGRDGQRRAACTWTWRIEERGHRDLGRGAGTQLAQDELAKVLCRLRGSGSLLGTEWDAWWEYREVDRGEITRRPAGDASRLRAQTVGHNARLC